MRGSVLAIAALVAAGCAGEAGPRSAGEATPLESSTVEGGSPAAAASATPTAAAPARVRAAVEVRGGGIGRDPTPIDPGRYRVVPDPAGGLRVVEDRPIAARAGGPPPALPLPEPPPAPAEPPPRPKIVEVRPH